MDTDGRRREIGRDLGRAARCRVAAAWKSCALRRAKPMTDSGTPQARLPMNKNLLIGLLAFTTLACGVLAVWSSQQRATLEVRVEQQAAVQPQAAAAQAKEAATAAAAEAELATLREQLAKSEATVRDLRGEVSLLRAGRGFGPSLSGRPGALPVPRAMLSEMLGKPETVGLAMDWIKADQYSRYAALIARQTQLTDAQREELRTVLAERYATRMDFSSAEADGALPEGQRREADAEFHQKLTRAARRMSRPAWGTKSLVKEACRRTSRSKMLLALTVRLVGLARPHGRQVSEALTRVKPSVVTSSSRGPATSSRSASRMRRARRGSGP